MKGILPGKVCYIAAAVVFACLAPSCAAFAAEKPSADSVAAALLSQEQACGCSLQADYTVTGRSTDGEPVPIWAIRYIRTPEFIYMEDKELNNPDEASATTNKFSYNRNTKDMKIVAVRSRDGTEVEVGWNLWRGEMGGTATRVTAWNSLDPLYMLSVPIYQAVRSGSIADETEVIDGSACWRVDVPGAKIGHGQNIAFVIWVDPAIGFCPRRITRMSQGVLQVGVSFSGYRVLGDGIWFPSKVVIEPADIDDGTVECDLLDDSVRVGVPVPPADIEITFKPGTKVRDIRLGAYFVVP